jgi:hypothetical protein
MPPHFPTWSEHPRDKVCGVNNNAFSKFSGFCFCHPCHDNNMLVATRHAIYSAALSTEETASVFFSLPGIKDDRKLLRIALQLTSAHM